MVLYLYLKEFRITEFSVSDLTSNPFEEKNSVLLYNVEQKL